MRDSAAHSFGKLRVIKNDELELMRSWRNQPDVRLNMYTSHLISVDEHLLWWERIKVANDQQYFMYERNARPLGIVAFNSINQSDRHSLWAFYTSPSAPMGTGSYMEFLALEYAFVNLQLHKLSSGVLAFNAAVIKLHLKFGFKEEGILRAQHNHAGKYVDVCRLGILADEWQEKRQAMGIKLKKLERY